MNHSPQERLNQVRAKIIEALPDIELGDYQNSAIEQSLFREITLADALRTIERNGESLSVSATGMFEKWEVRPQKEGSHLWELTSYEPRWNLALPLYEQEPEVISFLYKILCQ